MLGKNITRSQKISNALKGRPAAWIGSLRYDEIRKKISLSKKGKSNWKAGLKLKGVPKSNEHKRKLSEAKLKNPVKFWLGKKRPDIANAVRKANLGRKLTQIQRVRISLALKGKPKNLSVEQRKKMSERQKGSKAPNWKGGVSKLNKRIRASAEFGLWRSAVYERDNWVCQKCLENGKLHPHHILNFAEHFDLRFAIDNGITLCEGCHKKFHKAYGYKKNTIEQIKKYLN